MSKWVSFGIFAAIILGFIFPAGEKFSFLIPFLLGTILFFSFLKLEFKLKHFIRKELLYYLVIVLGALPLIIFFLTKNLEIDLRIGVFLVAITPTAVGAQIMSDMIKGDKELILSNIIIYNLLSPFVYAFMLYSYFNQTQISIPVWKIFSDLLLMVFLPLILALIARRYILFTKNLSILSKYFSPISFILVIGIAVSAASLSIRQMETTTLLILIGIMLLLSLASFLIGFLLSKKESTKKTLSLIFGHKNSSLTTYVALSSFSPIVAMPMVVYIVCQHIINGILTYIYSGKQ